MNEATTAIRRSPLTAQDLDVLSDMMIVFMHASEKCLRIIEQHYEVEYAAGNEYKRLRKVYGDVRAKQILGDTVKSIMRGDQRNRLGRIFKLANEFFSLVQNMTDQAIEAHTTDATNADSFNALFHDTNFLCYLYALMGNCDGKDDEIKIISTIKAFAKGKRVSENVLNKLNYMQQ